MGKNANEFRLAGRKSAAPFLVEDCAYEGVKRIAVKVAGDVEKVNGNLPEVMNSAGAKARLVLCATLGKSPLLEELVNTGKLDVSEVQGKREVFGIKLVEKPWAEVEEALVICGSDKRGTIYGMFSLSEYIGVSPLCYWGDADPAHRDTIVISQDIEIISKEPSVRYRGFFINDEWPCFGNWTFSHFGGFTAQMYDHVFELLLRLKGNYMWPAMWTSSFPLDGPGSLNEELADIYGVVIGFSHHEPCLRASEEWDQVRGPESIYGNEWNFYTNREGLIRYWEDALKRSGRYEHLITIGMRGERDTSMLGPDASLKQNIDLLKDIITTQRELIRRHVNSDLSQVPQLLALYKEVEAYFYGDGETEGLKDWDGLEGVTCMLCEDNFGYMRTLPTTELREKIKSMGGGFGMYYHFDYHGGPVSYEWMPSTPFSKIWEQMCMAYEYGVRDVWIVNVGDLKGNESALSYFMDLAYDYDTWGNSAPNSWSAYTSQWLLKTFPSVEESLRVQMGQVLTQYVDMNGMRRPESLHSGIYHPCHYLETDRMLDWAARIEEMNENIYERLCDKGMEKALDAYYSMIYYPAKISINLLRMHLYAGKNEHYARQGKTIANVYAGQVTECMEEDRWLSSQFSVFRKEKWKGMELEQHIGFVKWNEDNCRYPLRMMVEPAYKPRMVVSRKDSEEIAVKNYGGPMEILVDDFEYEGNEEVILEIANDGVGRIDYSITGEGMKEEGNSLVNSWLRVTPAHGETDMQQEVILKCDRRRLAQELQTVRLLIREEETDVAVVVSSKAARTEKLEPMTFLENRGAIAMEAHHFASSKDVEGAGFRILSGYGKSGHGMKVFPCTNSYNWEQEAPGLTYRFLLEKEGEYSVEFWTAPTNSQQHKMPLRFRFQTSCGDDQKVEVLSAGFRAGDHTDSRWCQGVLDQVRITTVHTHMMAGVQTVTVSAMEAGLVLERIIIHPEDQPIKISYLGPEESWYTGKE